MASVRGIARSITITSGQVTAPSDQIQAGRDGHAESTEFQVLPVQTLPLGMVVDEKNRRGRRTGHRLRLRHCRHTQQLNASPVPIENPCKL